MQEMAKMVVEIMEEMAYQVDMGRRHLQLLWEMEVHLHLLLIIVTVLALHLYLRPMVLHQRNSHQYLAMELIQQEFLPKVTVPLLLRLHPILPVQPHHHLQ